MSKKKTKPKKLQALMTADGYRILHGKEYVADVYGPDAERLVQLFAAADDLLKALDQAYFDATKFLNDGDFKRNVTWDAGYIVDAIKKAGQ